MSGRIKVADGTSLVSSGWESACQCRAPEFDTWSGKILHSTEQLSPCAIITEAQPKIKIIFFLRSCRWWTELHGNTYITIYKIDFQWECAVWLRELKPMFCDNLEGWDGMGGERWEGCSRGGGHGWFMLMYGKNLKEAECRRIDAFELWCWRRLLRVPWTARRSSQS